MLQLVPQISYYLPPTTYKTMIKGPEKEILRNIDWRMTQKMNLAVNFWLSGFKYILL